MAAPAFSSESSPDPGEYYVAVTPSDSTTFSPMPRAFYIGGTGNLVLTGQDGTDTTFSAIPAGFLLPVRATKVKSTSTTATLIVAIY